MRYLFILIIIAVSISGYYYYSSKNTVSLDNIMVAGDTVKVDAGDFLAEFSISNNFKNTYMIFGGDVISAKNIINPIALSGLEISDAAAIYKSYPDFHLCKSAGAPLAQNKTHLLNLIPADKKAFGELKSLIKKHEENFAKGAERICIAVTGKSLSAKSEVVPGKDSSEKMQIVHEIPRVQFYLISSSEALDCKILLNRPR